jgi:hypothetical protein
MIHHYSPMKNGANDLEIGISPTRNTAMRSATASRSKNRTNPAQEAA